MPIYVHTTLEVRAAGKAKFVATMKVIVPIMEKAGWKLLGAFEQRTGRFHTFIDLWELRDMNHYQDGLEECFRDPRINDIVAALAETVETETVVFASKAEFAH